MEPRDPGRALAGPELTAAATKLSRGLSSAISSWASEYTDVHEQFVGGVVLLCLLRLMNAEVPAHLSISFAEIADAQGLNPDTGEFTGTEAA